MIPREIAWRVFAQELNAGLPLSTGDGEYAPNYVITPLGAKVNRILLVGVLADVSNVGGDEEPIWRARVTDPTGMFYLTAGQYQPEASQVLSRLIPPAFVAVVGKTRVFSPNEGVKLINIRPENIRMVDKELRDYWVVETASFTVERIEAMSEAIKMSDPTPEKLVSLGFPLRVAGGVIAALNAHGPPDLDTYIGMTFDALQFVSPGLEYETSMRSSPPDEEDRSEEVLEIIRSLSIGDGITVNALLEEAKRRGIKQVQVEEAINVLMDRGLIYEPVLGKLDVV